MTALKVPHQMLWYEVRDSLRFHVKEFNFLNLVRMLATEPVFLNCLLSQRGHFLQVAESATTSSISINSLLCLLMITIPIPQMETNVKRLFIPVWPCKRFEISSCRVARHFQPILVFPQLTISHQKTWEYSKLFDRQQRHWHWRFLHHFNLYWRCFFWDLLYSVTLYLQVCSSSMAIIFWVLRSL